jgi:hypothetical protein
MEGAGQFYRDLRARGIEARIGMEASGYTRWFEQLMSELSSSCGSGMRPRSVASGYGDKRPTSRMRTCC